MTRVINAHVDALFVEGPDDGAVVNALVSKCLGIDLARRPHLVRTEESGGGAEWAMRKFKEYVATPPGEARVGLVIDRDGLEQRRDNWAAVCELLKGLGNAADSPSPAGHLVNGRFDVWMWPDNATLGDLESFVADIVPQSPTLAYATEASRIAKEAHGAEYPLAHARKAALKVRSIWRDASAAGGYGHLVHNLDLVPTQASKAFLAWFKELFLT